jgi:hypothetical protein
MEVSATAKPRYKIMNETCSVWMHLIDKNRYHTAQEYFVDVVETFTPCRWLAARNYHKTIFCCAIVLVEVVDMSFTTKHTI